MPTPPTLSIFATNSTQGHSFADRVKAEAEHLGFDARILFNSAQEDLAEACVFDDFIVFDASVEDGNNYAAAVELAKSLPYVFIVSRTYLPINFQGVEQGGAPDYPNHFNDRQILDWLKPQLRLVRKKPTRQKPKSFNLAAAISISQDIPDLPSSEIFISYRGPLIKTVEKLANKVKGGSFSNIGPKTVKIFQPAPRSFHQTAMTAFDRWAVLAIISDAIVTAKEVWVYDSKGEHEYLKSWWTIGELFVCAYRQQSIKRYNTANGHLEAPLPEHIVHLTEYHKDRLSKLFTNSHPMMMAPESVARIQNSWFLRLLPFYNDIVFTKTFTDLYLMQCRRCIDWQLLLSPDNFLDVESFCLSQIPGFYGISSERMNDKYVSCPKCLQNYRIIPKSPYLLWIPTDLVSGRPGYVQQRPIFELVEV